jgi:radical SAM protein with 4Fe4S-binding SPASM domain
MGEMLPSHTVKKLYEQLLSQSVSGLEIVTGDPLATQMQMPAVGPSGCTPFAGCAAGLSGLTLLADGTIVPCRRLEIPIGNVRTDSLREVWATSELLGQLRDKSNYTGKCGSCERWAACRGCRAIAFAYAQGKGFNNLLAADPQCFLDS